MVYRQTFLFSLEPPLSSQGKPGPTSENSAPSSLLSLPRKAGGEGAAVAAGAHRSLPAGLLAERLRQAIRHLETRSDAESEPIVYSSGGAALDALLPHGGFRPGTLVEWTSGRGDAGAMLPAMIAAAEVAAHPASAGRPVVVIDGGRRVARSAAGRLPIPFFYPPAAWALGIPASRTVIFRVLPRHTPDDLIWSIDQSLRSGAVAAVVAEVGDWLDSSAERRLQLAAETGGALGLFVRNGGEATSGQKPRAAFADVRWRVCPLAGRGGRRLRLEMLRCRGGTAGAVCTVEIDPRPDVAAVAAGGKGRITLLREGSGNVATTMVGDLVGRLADPAAAKRNASATHPRRRVG